MSKILDPRRNVSVSASAGSGKTWQLVSRITRLLLEGASPDGILALTFTRKAAAEMRERVESRLRELALSDDATLDAQLAQLQIVITPAIRIRARGLYEQVLFHPWPLRATTLHAFCQDLVARFPQQTGVSPDFEIIENERELLEASWQRVQKNLLANPQSPESQALDVLIAEGFNESGLRRSVIEFLYRRSDWRMYTHQETKPLDFAVERLREQLELGGNDPLLALASPAFNANLNLFCSTLEAAGNVGSVRAETVLPAQHLEGENRFEILCETLLTKTGTVRQFNPSQKVLKILGARADQMQQAFAEITEVLLRIREQQLSEQTLLRTQAAFTLGVAAMAELEQECRARNCLSFTDLEWLAYQLLTDPETGPWVQFKLDQRVDHLLLDEFQDTSSTQWQLLLPLLEEMAAGNPERPRSAFIVGDIKQSIYGFRRANPELLPEAARWMQENLQGHQTTLAQSYRSTPAIIEWVNTLFAGQSLLEDFPLHSTRQSGWGRVELASAIQPDEDGGEVQEPFRNPLTTPRADPENTRALREGQLIAKRIQSVIAARWQIEDNGDKRALAYGDVMILVRQRTHLQALEQALTAADIPFTGAARGTLLQTTEARDLLALLRFLLSPMRNLALAHALRSPIFGASDDDLIHLALVARSADDNWFAALQAQPRNDILQRALRLLKLWLDLAPRLPVHDLLDRICNEGNLAARYESALPHAQAARARGNLNAVIQLALEADSGRYPSLSRFLEELEQTMETQEAPDETPPPASSEQVRILTIHGAKGLEAPAVFLAQCAGIKQSKTTGWLVQWSTGDKAPSHFLLASKKEEQDKLTRLLLEERRQHDAIEDLNLLYVATTRARQFLHISGFVSKKASKERSWHQLASSAFESLNIPADAEGLQVFAQGEVAIAPATVQTETPRTDDPRLRQPIVLSAQTGAPPSGAAQPVDDATAVLRGKAIHWLIQQISESREERLRGRLEAQLSSMLKDSDFNAWLTEARAVCTAPALRRFFDPTLYRRAWNEVPLHHGDAFGVMDRLVDDGRALWVLDYKTQRNGEDGALIEQHHAQLAAYRAGVAQLWPRRTIHVGLVLTHTQHWIKWI